MKLIIINGPNLNLLGKREPEVYGSTTFKDYFKSLQEKYTDLELHYFQSNIEGEIIDKLHEFGFEYDGILLNAGDLMLFPCQKALKLVITSKNILLSGLTTHFNAPLNLRQRQVCPCLLRKLWI